MWCVLIAIEYEQPRERETRMKKLVEEDGTNPLIELLGQRLTFWCLNYIYTGDLVGVNDECIRLDNAAVVYETGPLNEATWQDAQSLPHPCYVMTRTIESFMILK